MGKSGSRSARRSRAGRASVSNGEIAAMLDELADLEEIAGANPFRIRAYRNAARFIAESSRSMIDMLAEGRDLSSLPGIGKAIAAKIEAIVETGRLRQLEEAKKRTPEALARLTHVRGLGPKRVKALYDELHIRSVADLKRALKAGRVRELEGFGAKTERLIEEGLRDITAGERRTPLMVARRTAAELLAYLEAVEGVTQVTVAGSYRRGRSTVGDLDILVACRDGSPVLSRFVEYADVGQVVSRGTTRSTVILRSKLQVDLRVVAEASYGAALQYFTGSKAHNVAIRSIAAHEGLKVNEYGVFRGSERIAGRTEKEVYASLGLPYIEPELRENRGEIEAAAGGRLPRLVTIAQIRGDLHCHTSASGGQMSLRALAMEARKRDYEYVAVTDHTTRAAVAHGLDVRRLERQIAAIDRLNDELEGIVLLKGAEVDILEDGSLDLPDDVLESLDIVVGAIHEGFALARRRQTERILRAMDHRCFNILAHPTGRLLGEREPYDLDLERVMEGARDRGCFLELNAQPARLDLSDTYCKLARESGVKLAVSADARRKADMELMELGISQARRGWLERSDVINTLGWKSLGRLLRRG
ncbi:MAG: DNA polymerase/3'-5' exonuclease PolX [Gammaproteobacteria bacterium]|nr:DNA polymerase/3'-5' exonuclease PolX [Gammaproteobacteria bacterium]NIM72652.1 DNA polymerase/3'-5' exonuclease PolX [Gammaproteobacteria bacterium]NIN37710.1 DNA polymerase/3'-5' exonuclease PolX [Gammaproteobacteria bacterium]NIO24413.1 DNA polymerase/3'-5' exonuclease PolX [Gammaproteobacteria bacterium]NIO65016.1 DNA polymerase/3'-5' exonuclease PolX [Gammaproteobacteria bacterium]